MNNVNQEYTLGAEVVSAQEAREKSRAVRNGILRDLTAVNHVIKDAIGRGRPFITVEELRDEVSLILMGRGYTVEKVGTHTWRIIYDCEVYEELQEAIRTNTSVPRN